MPSRLHDDDDAWRQVCGAPVGVVQRGSAAGLPEVAPIRLTRVPLRHLVADEDVSPIGRLIAPPTPTAR